MEFPKIVARTVQIERFEVACPKLFGQVDACVLSTMYHEKLISSQQLVVLVVACRAVSIELEKDSISRPSAVVDFKVHLMHENFRHAICVKQVCQLHVRMHALHDSV